jgi:hypothetical protein
VELRTPGWRVLSKEVRSADSEDRPASGRQLVNERPIIITGAAPVDPPGYRPQAATIFGGGPQQFGSGRATVAGSEHGTKCDLETGWHAERWPDGATAAVPDRAQILRRRYNTVRE